MEPQENMAGRRRPALPGWVGFLKDVPRDWKVTATRSSAFRFFYQMLLPYLSVYAMALGAGGAELGLVNSLGMVAAGAVSPFIGWLIDGAGLKRVYLIGILLLALSWGIYALAWNWTVIILAMLAYWIGYQVTGQSCMVVCGNNLLPCYRVTAMSYCETIAGGILSLVAPLVGAWLVGIFGGATAEGIRPLFYVAFAGNLATLFLITRYLSDRRYNLSGPAQEQRSSVIAGVRRLFASRPGLFRYYGLASFSFLAMGMVMPFTQAYAFYEKGASEFVLSAMVVGMAAMPFFLGVPLGRLADRIGRKKVLYGIAPLVWLSCLLLIWGQGSFSLIMSGVLLGFFMLEVIITTALLFEAVSAHEQSRWVGITSFSQLIIAALSSMLAGLIWDNLGPQYVFLAFIALDALIRLPMLIIAPETRRAAES